MNKWVELAVSIVVWLIVAITIDIFIELLTYAVDYIQTEFIYTGYELQFQKFDAPSYF